MVTHGSSGTEPTHGAMEITHYTVPLVNYSTQHVKCSATHAITMSNIEELHRIEKPAN